MATNTTPANTGIDLLQDETFETATHTSNLRDLKLLSRLWPFMKPHGRGLFWAFMLLPFVGGSQMLIPFIIRRAIDGPIRAGELSGLWGYVGLLLGVLAAHYVVRYVQMLVSQATGQKIIRDIRTALYAHLQSLSMSFFQRNPVGKLVTRLTSDVENLSEMLSSGGLAILQDIALIAGGVAGMFIMHWQLALITSALLVINIILMEFFRRQTRKAHNAIRIKLARLSAFVQENVTGIELVQLYRREAVNAASFDQLTDSYFQSRLHSVFWSLSFNSIVEFLITAANVVILWYAGEAILADEMTFGLLTAFFLFVGLVFEPIENVSEKMTILQSGLASIDKVMDLFNTTPEDLPESGRKIDRLQGAIRFEDVSFSYVPGIPVLDGVGFSAEPGQKIALVGPSGAGKTTIIKLLMRFYTHYSGRITVDGLDVKDINRSDLRRNIISIQQDDTLFSRSVAENITLVPGGVSALSPGEAERLREVARWVNAADLIARLGGFETVLNEQGKNLSMGERQLVLFARALYHDPAILILDEATSAIDSHTEQLIQQALDHLLVGRTSLVIAHRLSTIEKADCILLIDQGRIVEAGTHAELMARQGQYARFFNYQALLADERTAQEGGNKPA